MSRAPRFWSAAGRGAALAVLLLWSAVVLFPIYWIVVTSVKTPAQVNGGPVYVPFLDFAPSAHAWRYILVDLGNDTLRPFANSALVAFFSTSLAVALGGMAAYGLARIEYAPKAGHIGVFLLALAGTAWAAAGLGVHWAVASAAGLAVFVVAARALAPKMRRRFGNGDILFWLISQRILPPVATVGPIYVMFQNLNLLDTRTALVVTYMTVNLPVVVWIMHDFFRGIPRDLEESAALDGASRLAAFFLVALPLARGGLAATFLLVWILSWNEYLLALFLSTADAQTMPLLVAAQNATRGPQWWYMSALIVLMIAPVVALAAGLMRLISRGLLVGAVKG